MLIIDSIEALSTRVDALKGYLNIEQKRIEVMDEEKQTQDPDFWNDSKKAELVMKQIRSKKSWVIKFDDCASKVEDLYVLYEFMKAGEEDPAEVDAAFKTCFQRKKIHSMP
jgi:peptide chain release factor 2